MKSLQENPFQKVAECLYRHASSKAYYALVKVEGKQIRRSLKTTDRKLAERRLKEFRAKVEQLNPASELSGATFEATAMKWFESIRETMKQKSALRRCTSLNQLKPFFGSLPIRNITRAACDRWVAARSPQIAPSTFNNERETLSLVFEYAIREGIILEDPSSHIRRRKLPKNELIIPSVDQFSVMIRTMRSLDVRYRKAADLVELMAYSGMRLGEATSIKWKDIDFDKGKFTVTGGKSGTKNSEVRVVPLFPALEAFLKRLKARVSHNPEGLISPIGNAKKAINKACELAALPHFNHHSMRHFFVSNAIEVGVDFKTIAAWVGHKDGGILVAQTYGHLRDPHSEAMAKLMKFGV